jgi:putative ATP-dependent endonuclease of OLD family
MALPHIAHVSIANFRNFERLEIDTDEKQLIIGENATGKSNYIRALRLILDPSMSDQDRQLVAEDFPNGIANPMETGKEIEISIHLDGYKDSKALRCIIDDAVVSLNDRDLAKITYRFAPIDKTLPLKGYRYTIFKGNDTNNKFDSFCRKYLNIKVVHALRDVDSDLMSSRRSPLNAIINKYKIDLEDECYRDIFDAIHAENSKLLEVDEIADVRTTIKGVIDGVLQRYNSEIDMGLAEFNPSKFLSMLRIYESGRNLSETSLGICNVIYIQLVLQQVQTQSLPTLISKDLFENMEDNIQQVVDKYYNRTPRSNYVYGNSEISASDYALINDALSQIDESRNSTTILVIEEPEAHLHPSFQRMIYKDVFVNPKWSIIMTTHSPHLASICPIKYIVSFRKNLNELTDSSSACNIQLTDRERKNLQRYIDVNRGEVFFGKGVILVEGISEQILAPAFAEKMSKDLDSKGVIICNINSTNFRPYIKLLDQLCIPCVVITDGDAHCSETGEKRIEDLCRELYIEDVITGISDWKQFFRDEGYFIGENTLEIDLMKSFQENKESGHILVAFNHATIGGSAQKKNFSANYAKKDYDACLRAIGGRDVGKGRFAQELALSSFKKNSIPEYARSAINAICELV